MIYRALVAAQLMAWLMAGSAAEVRAAPPDPGIELIALDEHVAVPAPPDMTHELRSLGPRGDMLTLADGSDVMVVVVYRRGVQDKAPSAAQALAMHADELERALGGATRRAVKLRVLGRDQPALALSVTRAGIARSAWVVAVEARGRTVVISAIAVEGSPNEVAMQGISKGIRVQ